MMLPAALLACCCSLATPDAGQNVEVSPPPIYVVYFTPNDRELIPGYEERLEAVMEEVQDFYRQGMKAHGYGEVTFGLERDDDGRMVIHVVKGSKGTDNYGRNSHWDIHGEVRQAMIGQGLEFDRRVTMVFTNLLLWEDGKAIEHGPYCGFGMGTHIGGSCCAYDDALLHPDHLSSNEQGGYYWDRPCTIGEFNSHYIGGVAHELGHALSLLHVKEKASERHLGNALMGRGNHTYGRDLRTNQTGTFLTKSSAMLLSTRRSFAGDLKNASDPKPECKFTNWREKFDDGVVTFSGKIESDVPAYGIVAYHDDKAIQSDYDAVGWTCDVKDDGTFELKVGEFTPGEKELRFRVYHESGHFSRFQYTYMVDEQGLPDRFSAN
jgi:hypothetical protein